ncbi:hypothetical protein ACTWJ8_39865 (plasmid) [Streptomyces sp. SDT5-1]|uniref:hypothetical protein n=1 Tax=Streptomyces sp. SDT5-1 TaxID=3406418 RepID=UPI003FCF95F7
MEIPRLSPLPPAAAQLAPGDTFTVALPAPVADTARAPHLHVVDVSHNRVVAGYLTVATQDGTLTLPCDQLLTMRSMTRSLPLACLHCGTVEWVRMDLAHFGVPAQVVCTPCADRRHGGARAADEAPVSGDEPPADTAGAGPWPHPQDTTGTARSAGVPHQRSTREES